MKDNSNSNLSKLKKHEKSPFYCLIKKYGNCSAVALKIGISSGRFSEILNKKSNPPQRIIDKMIELSGGLIKQSDFDGVVAESPPPSNLDRGTRVSYKYLTNRQIKNNTNPVSLSATARAW